MVLLDVIGALPGEIFTADPILIILFIIPLSSRPNVFPSLFGYLIVNVGIFPADNFHPFCFQFFLVAICITLALPAGIFVPSFVIGACGGRIIGELVVEFDSQMLY